MQRLYELLQAKAQACPSGCGRNAKAWPEAEQGMQDGCTGDGG